MATPDYDVLRARLGNEEARAFIVAQLRRLADHIESGKFPQIYTASAALCTELTQPMQRESVLADYDLCLSHPWGG